MPVQNILGLDVLKTKKYKQQNEQDSLPHSKLNDKIHIFWQTFQRNMKLDLVEKRQEK